MADKLADLVRFTTTTTGTGTLTVGSAVVGYLTPAQAGIANGDVVLYAISDGANSEAGRGTYSSTGPTLTRTPFRSTAGGSFNSAINLSGSAQVVITALAEVITLSGSLTTNKVPKAANSVSLVDSLITDDGSSVVINVNSAAAPTPPTGTVFQLVGADSAVQRIVLDAFGASPTHTGRRADGTNASKTSTGAGASIFSLTGHSYTTSGTPGYTTAAATIVMATRNATTDTDHSTSINFNTTPAGSTTLTNQGAIGEGYVIGNPAGGYKGTGTLNVELGVYINGKFLADLYSSQYVRIYDYDGNGAIYLGSSGDPGNYFRNSSHHFQSINGGSEYAYIGSTGIDCKAGVYRVAGSQIAAANLADYSTGTFTPTLAGSGVAGTHTYSTQVGRWTKFGNKVWVEYEIVTTAIDSSATGNWIINWSGSSVPAANASAPHGSCWFGQVSGVTLSTNYNQIAGSMPLSGVSITLKQLGSGQTQANIAAPGNLANATTLIGGCAFST